MTKTTEERKPRNPLTAILTNKGFIFLLRIVLAVVFIYASYDKILHPHQFAIAVRAYKILPISVSNLFALMLAWSEMIAAVLLILGIFTREAAAALFLLLATFIIAITTTLIRGMVIDCGCFKAGEGHDPIDFGLLTQDTFLLIAALLVICYDKGFLSLSRLFSSRSN
jgi:uncharacterized membrane protein YphA (DoxX/SURF4 family)